MNFVSTYCHPSVINRIPDYLKLFVEDGDEPPKEQAVPEFSRLCSIFPEATGLSLEVSTANKDNQLTFPWSDSRAISYRVSIKPTKRSNLQSLTAAKELEEALATILTSLGEARNQLRNREAELAAAVPVVSVEEDGEHLAERLKAVLRGTADMLHCYGAGLYLLDENTTTLKLRSHFGLNEEAFVELPRPLEEAKADIEAMAGRAVVIEDSSVQGHWPIPASSRAAMCVPVSSATTILGTLWMFRDEARDFTPTEQNLAEITAGRLASDLERAVLTQEVRALRNKQALPGLNEKWVDGTRSRLAPALEGWEVSDSFTNAEVAGDFCQWHFVNDDRVHLAVGAAHGTANRCISSVAFSATHAAHTAHDPTLSQVFGYNNQSQWTSSVEGAPSSLFHAILDPTCGALHYGIAGGVFAYVLRPHGWEPLLASKSALGVDVDFDVESHRQMLMPGDILVAMSCPTSDRGFDQNSRMNQIAEKLLHNTHLSAVELADLATSQMEFESASDPGNLRHAVLVARREG